MKETLKNLFDERMVRVVLSQPKKKDQKIQKIVLKWISEKKRSGYQEESFSSTQVFHRFVEEQDLIDEIAALMEEFRQCHCFTESQEAAVKVSKKGKLFVLKQELKEKRTVDSSHNRKKKTLLPEDEVIGPLVDLGIMTKEGQIISSKRQKLRQINRFLELVDDCLKENQNEKKLRIVDFGCGKSYLTFILYYYLHEVRKLNVEITGLDLKTDVIAHCQKVAESYGYSNLYFKVGNVESWSEEEPVDLVVTLHACDTATDYALYHAVRQKAKAIMSVPCCHHELSTQVTSERFESLIKYGIIKERMCALFTDTIRAQALVACGYQTQVLEFIDMDHSLKNLMIRAVKKPVSESMKKKAMQQIKELSDEFSLNNTMVRCLIQEGLLQDFLNQ
ncbi:MAG: SAM-dependent methyltransferase [Erysipelotrichaceae bacterium]|nr:SAM-dependent methyltransferase [Erysipelotrichaceae bacterium]